MNIDIANYIPATSVQSGSDVGSQWLSGQETLAGFAEAFIEQLKLLTAGGGQQESLSMLPTKPGTEDLNSLQDLAELLQNGSDMQNIAALLGQKLPVSYKLADDKDLEATLSALAESLTFAKSGQTPLPVAQADDPAETVAPELQQMLGLNNTSASDTVVMPADSEQSSVENSSNSSQAGNTEIADVSEAVVNPIIVPVNISDGQNTSTDPAEKITPVLQQIASALLKDKPPGPHVTSDEAFTGTVKSSLAQTPVAEPGSEQNKFAVNPGAMEGFSSIAKNTSSDHELLSTADKSQITGAIADLGQAGRQALDGKTEVPALVRPLGHPEWNKELGERILWMNTKAIPSAEIKLNPQHLGPISVRIDVNQDQATISFAAQHGSVREAIEASIPRLREMMNGQQIDLTNVNVSQHFSSDHGRSPAQSFNQAEANSNSESDSKNAEVTVDSNDEIDSERVLVTKGLLNMYA